MCSYEQHDGCHILSMQDLLTFSRHMRSPRIFLWGSCCTVFSFLCLCFIFCSLPFYLFVFWHGVALLVYFSTSRFECSCGILSFWQENDNMLIGNRIISFPFIFSKPYKPIEPLIPGSPFIPGSPSMLFPFMPVGPFGPVGPGIPILKR